jgi:hypothetical protein
VELHKKYPRDVACVSLSVDFEGADKEKPQDHRERVLKFLRAKGAAFDNVLAAEASDVMFQKLGINNPPAVFVYRRGGQLAKRFPNTNAANETEAFTYKDVDRLVANLIGK